MKTSNLIIRIPEPCHEEWNNMLPDAKGKFCNSCNKSVFDFSNKTDNEIRDILVEYKQERVCGRFNTTQVNRPLNISIDLNDLPKNISIAKAFAIALFIVFGTFLFSCTNEQGQKINTIEVVTTGQSRTTLGEPMFGTPLPLTDSIAVDSVFEETVVNMVAGGIQFDYVMDSIVTLDEVPGIETTEPVIDYVTMGEMSYVILDSVKSEETTTLPDSSFKNNSKMRDNTITEKATALSVYPNPSNGEFSISYDISKRSDVSLVIYDMKGLLIRSLVNVNDQYGGKYQIPVNLSDLPNGIYIVSLIIGDKKSTERIVIER